MVWKFKNRLKFFLENGYVHGLRYMGSRCRVYGKLFWLIVMITSAWQMSRIFISTYHTFENDATNINVDTAYLHWNNTFPAVSICFSKGRSTNAIRSYLKNYWEANNIKPPRKIMSYIKLLQSYLFQSPNQPIDIFDEYCREQNSTCGLNFKILQNQFLPKACYDFIVNVTFLGKPYNCSKVFKFFHTEMGFCYIANSLYSYNLQTVNLPLKFNRNHHDTALKIFYRELETVVFTLYVHSPEDLPYFNSNGFNLRKSDSHVSYLFNIIEMKNQEDVSSLPIQQRNCRFPKEKIKSIQMPYSFSSCFLDLRVGIELKLCNCTLNTSPKTSIIILLILMHLLVKEKFCNYEGLKCIRKSEINMKAKQLHYQKDTECMQSCIEMDVTNVGEIETNFKTKGEPASIEIKILDKPNIRYWRQVAQTQLDLVVTIGGVFGLFFGASLLTIFQFFYIWIIRKF